jgi:predicted dehydrogenase
MADPLRVGLIGCGAMGRQHLEIIRRQPDVALAGVCDSAGPAAAPDAETPLWTDVERFLDEAQPDAIHICSPTGLHGVQAILAAERGIHVLSEKPLDVDIDKVDRLIALCDRNDLRLGCIFQRRAIPSGQTVQRAIAEGRMGRLLSCSIAVKWWRSDDYYRQDSWRGTWQMDGGALANQGIHSLDQMVWMAGPVAEVEYAHIETAMHSLEAEDLAFAAVRFESGARGTIEVTTCCRPDLATRLEVYGTHGSAAFEDALVTHFGLDGQDLTSTLVDRGVLTGGGSEPMKISLYGHNVQIADFYAAVREHRAPLVDGREARHSIDLLTKIYRKAAPGLKLGL